MRISFEEKKAEAVARMKMLHLHPDMIRKFESELAIICFEGPFGSTINLSDESIAKIRQLEADWGILVYAVLFGEYNIGTMASCLYVSDYPEEWENDRQNIENSKAMGMASYVINLTDPDLSEFGYIGVDRAIFGGLKRVW